MSYTLAELKQALQLRLGDPGSLKHPPARYEEAINKAVREWPRRLWLTQVDTSLTTADETKRYALAGLTDLDNPGQMLRVWIDDEDSNPHQIGRWEVEDDKGTLTLVLDDDPTEASLTITLEYQVPPAWSGGSIDLDFDWIVAKAATALLLEADPDLEDPRLVQADIERFDAMRQAREADLLLGRTRRSGKVRSHNWRRS